MTPSGRTLSEKVLSSRAGQDARARDFVVCAPDLILGTDGSTPMALDYFESMGGGRVLRPERVLLARDHYAPPTSESTRAFHARMRAFAEAQQVALLPVGAGIGFQVAMESGRVSAGDLVVGADSHTVTCGALGAFATGIGSADLAGALLAGQVWLRVPETWRVVLEGTLSTGVVAKDVALELVRRIGADGAAYTTLEFVGPAVEAMPVEERMVLCNLSAEVGAKAGIVPGDHRAGDFVAAAGGKRAEPTRSDADAVFAREVRMDVTALEPMVALPHDPGLGVEIGRATGTTIDFVFLGTCAGGRSHDFREALRVLEAGGGIADGVTVVATPASAAVRDALEADGTLARLAALGAVVTETGCGSCCGTSPVLPPPGARVLSTANRNFRGRMGDATASIHLASPATCAAAATAGRIVDPRDVA